MPSRPLALAMDHYVRTASPKSISTACSVFGTFAKALPGSSLSSRARYLFPFLERAKSILAVPATFSTTKYVPNRAYVKSSLFKTQLLSIAGSRSVLKR